MTKDVTLSIEEFNNFVTVIMDSHKKEKELVETIHRLVDILDQQQGSTETIEKSVGRFLEEAEATYLHSGVMGAVNLGLFNSKIVPLLSTGEEEK